ncbi:somatomedin-B and thrombospondin type-1 domain-containing protein [Sitodiplosis mosellana]|uniref:somatomedin-B and thrombospondin type-1 domain-containing protein n=1 Tax=Sitodiplosis mosellana TaxID=263140 RepID=UPI00244514A0|nr:somatomedin-B and thrombospondin type-1 domain-containing protein [Sitodiplosis mosellana]
MLCSMKSVVAVLLVGSLMLVNRVECGSCRESTLCCNGRDSSCVVQKAPINSIIEDLNDKPCYCDHACLKLGDCCSDFKQYCGVIDCTVSEWGVWSECDVPCGTGMMSRTRSILNAPENGGKHCPSLVQKRGCQGFKCHGQRDRRVLREMALLLPAELSKSRHENDTVDIRRNLRLRYRDTFKHNRDHEYCVEFEVIKAAKACHKLPPYNKLTEGDRVVIRCDLEALQKDTEPEEITDNSSIHEDSPSFRCRGEGLPGRNTRWSALAAPSCRGKWLRLTVGQPKKCTDSQFIFI